jgi:hypothetical protein
LHHVFPYDAENSWLITANVSSFPTDCLPRDEAAAWLPFREDREILNFRRTEGGIRLAFSWQVGQPSLNATLDNRAMELSECCVSRFSGHIAY